MEGDYVIWPEEDISSTAYVKKEESIPTSKYVSWNKIKYISIAIILLTIGSMVLYSLYNFFITVYDPIVSAVLIVVTGICCLVIVTSLLFMIYLTYCCNLEASMSCKKKLK